MVWPCSSNPYPKISTQPLNSALCGGWIPHFCPMHDTENRSSLELNPTSVSTWTQFLISHLYGTLRNQSSDVCFWSLVLRKKEKGPKLPISTWHLFTLLNTVIRFPCLPKLLVNSVISVPTSDEDSNFTLKAYISLSTVFPETQIRENSSLPV